MAKTAQAKIDPQMKDPKINQESIQKVKNLRVRKLISFEQIQQDAQFFKDCTRMDIATFNKFASQFGTALAAYLDKFTLDGNPRSSAYRPNCALETALPTPADKMFFILHYLTSGQTQSLHAGMYGISQSSVSKWHPILLDILEQAAPEYVPKENLADVQTTENQTVSIYATECDTERSKNADKQKSQYSGKKKAPHAESVGVG